MMMMIVFVLTVRKKKQAKLVMTTAVPLTALFLDESEINSAVTASAKTGDLATAAATPSSPKKTSNNSPEAE